MSTITASPISGLTDEQRNFQAAIRDFAERECGTAEQREQLTNHYEELHNQEIYEQLGELGWLGVSVDEAYGGAGAGMVDACVFLEETMRGLVPIAGYGVSLIVAGAYERFGNEEQKQEILSGICRGRVEAIAMSEPGAGSDVGALSCKAEKVDERGRVRAERAEDLDQRRPPRRPHPRHRPLRQLGLQARGPDDVLGPDRRRGRRDPRDPDDGRQGGQRRLPDRLLHRRRAGARRARQRLDAADGGVERRAADPRRHRPGHRAAGVRRPPRLRQGAPAVRPSGRLVPVAQAPDRRPRDRARMHPPAGLRRRPQGRRRSRRCSPARPRWRSSRPPRSPSTSPSKGCR